MVGPQILDLFIEVRVLTPQHSRATERRRKITKKIKIMREKFEPQFEEKKKEKDKQPERDYDLEFRQEMSEYFGEIHKGFQETEDLSEKQKKELDNGFRDIHQVFADLAHKRKVEKIQETGQLDEFADGLSVMSDFFSRCKKSEVDGYEHYDQDIKEKAKSLHQKSRKMFMQVGGKLFPEAHIPDSSQEREMTLKSMLKAAKGLPKEIQPRLEFIAQSNDPNQISERIYELIQYLGETNGFLGYSDGEFGVNSESQKTVVEITKLMYQLELVQQGLQKEILISKDDRDLNNIKEELKEGNEKLNRKEVETKAGKTIGFLRRELGWPFMYDQRFNKLSDSEFNNFADAAEEITKEWRSDRRPRYEKNKEYIERVNSLIEKYTKGNKK